MMYEFVVTEHTGTVLAMMFLTYLTTMAVLATPAFQRASGLNRYFTDSHGLFDEFIFYPFAFFFGLLYSVLFQLVVEWCGLTTDLLTTIYGVMIGINFLIFKVMGERAIRALISPVKILGFLLALYSCLFGALYIT